MSKYLLILLSVFTYSQEKLSLNLISIEKSNSQYNTHFVYKITYSIKNNTPNELSFFFNPEYIPKIYKSSLSNTVCYKMYESGKEIPFFSFDRDDKGSMNVFQYNAKLPAWEQVRDSIINDYKKNGGRRDDITWILRHKQLKRQIFKLLPNETQTFTYNLFWNKIPTILDSDGNENYLDKNKKYEMDLHLILIKKGYKNSFEEEEFLDFEKNPNFIEGYFYSNKIEVKLF